MKTSNAKLRKTFKASLDLSQDVLSDLHFLSCVMIKLWNAAVEEGQRRLDSKQGVNAYAFNYWLTGMRDNSVYLEDGREIFLRDIGIDVEREVLRKLAGSYASYFELRKNKDNRARLPKQKKEEWFQTLSWSFCKVVDNVLSIAGYQRKRLEIILPEYLANRVVGKSVVHATISQNLNSGKFELSIVTAMPAVPLRDSQKFIRAIDFGAGDVAVSDSDGTEFLIPVRRGDKHWRKIIQSIEARVKKCVKGSRSYERLMSARRKVFTTSLNQHTSFQRKLAHALAEEKVTEIILGKARTRLGLAQSKGTGDQHWGVQNTGYMSRFPLFMKEKAQERGIFIREFSDPHRKGELHDAESKFMASRALLNKGLEEMGMEVPKHRIRKKFAFKQ